MEIWKIIPGFSNYKASSGGRIKNKRENILSQNPVCLFLKFLVLFLNLRWVDVSTQNKNRGKTSNPGYEIEMLDKTGLVSSFVNVKTAREILKINKQDFSRYLKNKTGENGYWFRYKEIDNLENEIWKKINKSFWISNYGRAKDVQNRLRKSTETSHGYEVIFVNNKLEYVHRLVAFHFVPNIRNENIVNHKDNIGTNNHYLNLEWCTQKHNSQHGIQFNDSDRSINCNSRKVYKYNVITKKLIKEYDTLTIASKDDNITAPSMYKRINKKTTVKNNIWSFEKVNDFSIYKHPKNKPIYKINSLTLKVEKIYEKIEDAAKAEKITPTTMRRISKENTQLNGFIFSREEIKKGDPIKKLKKIQHKKKVEKINKLGEIIYTYDSITQGGISENISTNTLKYRIEKNVIRNEISFRYKKV